MTRFVDSSAALNAERRRRDIEDVRSGSADIDLIVIGGGITGAGIALDAASRGLHTVLVEKHDLAFGTSRWSSKLAHGGLRYLAKFELAIAHNSAVERGILMRRTAPHLVRALPQVTPLAADTNLIQKAAVRAGYIAGDLLRITAGTPGSVLPRSRFKGKKATLELCPQALRTKLVGSWVNYDGQMVDDARLVTAVARTAAEKGARILTYCEASNPTGRSVEIHDTLNDERFTLSARCVIAATGVWAQQLDPAIRVRPARGTHLVVDAAAMGNPTGALTIPLEGSISRYLFVLPEEHGRCYIGLTDEPAPREIPDVPPSPEEDIEFLLKGINRALNTPLRREDVRGAFTGLRPLIESTDDGSQHTSDLSRRHAIIHSDNGLISITGGKFTEYRLMAEQAVDAAVAAAGLNAQPCRTRNLPLIGAPSHPLSNGADPSQDPSIPRCIVRRFGYEAREVVSSCPVERPLDMIAGVPDVTRAEIAYAITHEGALSVDDVLDRRTRIGLIESDREQALPEVEEIFTALQSDASGADADQSAPTENS